MNMRVFIFWVAWSAVTVTIDKKGIMTQSGGVWVYPVTWTMPSVTSPGTYWHKSGLFYDTKKDCEQDIAKKYSEHYLVCLPDGVIPK